jgi:hypothetical protein
LQEDGRCPNISRITKKLIYMPAHFSMLLLYVNVGEFVKIKDGIIGDKFW